MLRDGTALWIHGIDSSAEVRHAQSAAECAAHLGRESFDLLFLDLALPDKPGLETLSELKSSHPALPVVILSASDDDATILEALRRGAMGFIPKTAGDPEVFRGYLARAMGGNVTLPTGMIERQRPIGVLGMRRSRPVQAASELGLSPRQVDVLRHLVAGMANKEIARRLEISPNTVRDYVSDLLATFGVKSRVQLVIEVGRHGLTLR